MCVGEKDMDIINVNVAKAIIPPSTQENLVRKMTDNQYRWGKYFENQDKYEMFVMLPISDEQRDELMDQMKK